ncbi:hypothetical protein AVEN_56199-1 [Araneus ventricosus]|uniref:Reverse transcriptase domain-containing protein n=1 Tax=Araneus ventricosus TaxID=182803 RepID=A0A4Y2P1K3_ARAVE|nr:hypothetical protein AVEN_56199-1 [Araneus ventricosus]
MKATNYLDILDNSILWQQFREGPFLFQHDRAPVHTERVLQHWFDDMNVEDIRCNTLTWISDYLHQRFIRVKFNKTLSNTFHLSQGVPQETVLSPTLFALYMAGIENVVSPGTHIGLFADGIALWSSGNIIVGNHQGLNLTVTSFN